MVLKDAVGEHLSACIRAVMQGQYWLEGRPVQNLVQVLHDLAAQTAPPSRKTFGLTARELEVVTLITEGSTNKHIAMTFGISEETVKRHLTNIFNKLGVGNRLELALFALNHNLLPPTPRCRASERLRSCATVELPRFFSSPVEIHRPQTAPWSHFRPIYSSASLHRKGTSPVVRRRLGLHQRPIWTTATSGGWS